MIRVSAYYSLIMDQGERIEGRTWVERQEWYFQALADRTRLRILNLLAAFPEVCVGDLVDIIGTNQPKVSRHLAYLRRHGLIATRREGLRVHYRLARPADVDFSRVLDRFLSCCREVDELRWEIDKLVGIVSDAGRRGNKPDEEGVNPGAAQAPIEVELL